MRTLFLCLCLGPLGLTIALLLNRADRLEAEAQAAAEAEAEADEVSRER